MQPALTLPLLKQETQKYCRLINSTPIASLYGVTDGKAVGTHVEHELREYLYQNYAFEQGSSAAGIDFPGTALNVDLKVTSVRQPQSSCPYRSASQKVYGLGYNLLIIVYDKIDDDAIKAARLQIQHVIFVSAEHTGDYQTTMGLRDILQRNGNADDIYAFLEERNLPLDEIGKTELAERILKNSPAIGYLTISNALQWRLQYSRAIQIANQGTVTGLEDLFEQRMG